MSTTPSVPFAGLLAELPRWLGSDTLVFTLSSRDPIAVAPALRRLRSSGFEVRHVALGPRSKAHAAAARRVGIDALYGRLEPDWRTSDALTLVG